MKERYNADDMRPKRRTWEDIKNDRLAQMTPEQRAHFKGYSLGFKESFEMWDEEMAGASLRHLLRLRRQAKRRRGALTDGGDTGA